MICAGESELSTRQPSTAHTKSHAHQRATTEIALLQFAQANGAPHSQADISECSLQHRSTAQHNAGQQMEHTVPCLATFKAHSLLMTPGFSEFPR